MFIAALFTIANIWKQPVSIGEKINLFYVCVFECINIQLTMKYSSIKKNAVLSFITTWMGLEGIMVSKVS